MKTRIAELIQIYLTMRSQTRSKIRRELLDNIIEDLRTALRESQ